MLSACLFLPSLCVTLSVILLANIKLLELRGGWATSTPGMEIQNPCSFRLCATPPSLCMKVSWESNNDSCPGVSRAVSQKWRRMRVALNRWGEMMPFVRHMNLALCHSSPRSQWDMVAKLPWSFLVPRRTRQGHTHTFSGCGLLGADFPQPRPSSKMNLTITWLSWEWLFLSAARKIHEQLLLCKEWKGH